MFRVVRFIFDFFYTPDELYRVLKKNYSILFFSIPGRGVQGARSPLIFRRNRGPKETWPPTNLKVWMTSPTPSISRSGSDTD